MKHLSFKERANYSSNAVAKRLFQIMDQKKSNLFLSADFTSQKEVLQIADQLGPHIAGVKTHVDILNDFTPSFSKELQKLSIKHSFVIFEDRKFADIGNTVKKQFGEGIFRICDWADIINAHILPGPGIIEGLKEIGEPRDKALLLLAQMSSQNALISPEYTQKCIDYAKQYKDFVIGFISLQKLSPDPAFIHFTPGVKFLSDHDTLGQKYRSLEEILEKNQSDIIIVGRDILQAKDPLQKAQLYHKEAWHAYEKRFS